MDGASMDLNASTIVQLRAFEAVGRHGSFKRAAEELFVTQAALSHHVRHLEQDLGVQLVRRLHRRIELTDEGAQLLSDCARALGALSAALRNVKRAAKEDVLTIGVQTYFSLRWLTPRLGSLWQRHPGINVQLHHIYQAADFVHNKIDAEIAWGHGQWPDVDSTLVLKTRLTPVCSPAYLERLPDPARAEDLLGHMLFYEVDLDHWRQWFEAAGVDHGDRFQAMRIDDPHALRQVALDGHGFALFYAELSQDDLRGGQLVAPFPLGIDTGGAYYLNRPRDAPASAKLQTFTRWILEEVDRRPAP
jgi:DNA-binding transcriptional LysR family regulator